MSIPPTQIMQAEIIMSGIMTAAGSTAIRVDNVFHYSRIANVVTPTKAALETAFQSAIATPLLALLNLRYTQTLTSIRWMNDPTDQALPFAESGVGVITGDSMPSENYAYILLRCGLKGGSYKGNKKIGPLSESDTTTASADVLNAAAIARFATLQTALLAGITDGTPNTWRLGVWSRMLQEQIVLPSIAIAPVTTVLLNKRVSTMKKRKSASVY